MTSLNTHSHPQRSQLKRRCWISTSIASAFRIADFWNSIKFFLWIVFKLFSLWKTCSLLLYFYYSCNHHNSPPFCQVAHNLVRGWRRTLTELWGDNSRLFITDWTLLFNCYWEHVKGFLPEFTFDLYPSRTSKEWPWVIPFFHSSHAWAQHLQP